MVEKMRKYWPASLSSELVYQQGEKTLYEYLVDHARNRGDRTAYIFYGNEISWSSLLEEVNGFASYLKQKGVIKGTCVGLYLQNCPQYIVAHYAIQQLGGVVVPLNPMYKADELTYFFEETPIYGIVTSDDGYAELQKANTDSLSFTVTTNYKDYIPDKPTLPICEELTFPKRNFSGSVDFQTAINMYPPLEKSEQVDVWHDIGLMVFTSGTTGRPKGAQLTYGNALFKTAASAQANGISKEDRIMANAPLSHIAGMVMGVNMPVYTGIPCVLFTRFDPFATVKAIERYKITSWYSIAPMNGAILQIPDIKERNLSSLKNNLVPSFGLQVTEDLANKWKAVTKGCVMYEAA